jgi:hypothetical protein
VARRTAAFSSGASELGDVVKPALARIFTGLHSSQWKTRYGGEFEALLVDVPATPGVIVDVVRSALRSQRRVVAAGLFAAIALAAFSFGVRSSTPHANVVADNIAVPGVSHCASYSSIPDKAHGKCALG